MILEERSWELVSRMQVMDFTVSLGADGRPAAIGNLGGHDLGTRGRTCGPLSLTQGLTDREKTGEKPPR